MSQAYVPARDKYKPRRRTRFLLIAESPPASGGYFYFDKTTGADHLFRETMKALKLFPEEEGMPTGFDKKPLLERFRSLGFFVLDASYKPVDKMSRRERRTAIMTEIQRLVADTRMLDPERIIIVKVSIFNCVKSALEDAGFGERILNKVPLPFPSHGNQKIYRKMLRELIIARS